jgi:S1-C subfamily serine protease
VVQDLIEHGHHVHLSVGVVGVSVTPQLAYTNRLPVDRGVLVTRVESESPAEVAGIEAGDIITATGGWRIRNLQHFHEVLRGRGAGETIEVGLLRDGREVSVRLALTGERTGRPARPLERAPVAHG